jgi:hypothetical protein
MGNLMDRESATGLWGGESDPDQYIVLGIDPGGFSGWTVMGVHPDALSGDPDVRITNNVEFWVAGEFTGAENSQCDEIFELVEQWPSARLIIEDFIDRRGPGGREVLSPVRITSVLEWAVRPRYWIKQQPSLAMTTITDDRQMAMGFWIPGKEHARDATKHCLTFLKRQRDRQIKASAAFKVKAEMENGSTS